MATDRPRLGESGHHPTGANGRITGRLAAEDQTGHAEVAFLFSTYGSLISIY